MAVEKKGWPSMFTKAVKYESSLKMSLSGPPGSGKTWTSLTLATALADGRGVALIDTEHGSASLYADHFSFDTLELDSYHPQRFIDAVAEAEHADYAVLIIDSLSHDWNGKGGLLEIVDMIAARRWTTCRKRTSRRARPRSASWAWPPFNATGWSTSWM